MLLEPKAWIALAPVIGLAVDVAAHLAATWLLRLLKLYPRLLVGAICGGAATITIALAAAGSANLTTVDTAALVAFDAATFAILSFGYFNFVQLNISSLRVRIANEIHDSPAGLEPQRLTELYNAQRVVDERLDRLARGGQIELRNGRYYHRKSLVYAISLAMDACKRITLGRRVGETFRERFPGERGT
jgi:hypothetical protein